MILYCNREYRKRGERKRKVGVVFGCLFIEKRRERRREKREKRIERGAFGFDLMLSFLVSFLHKCRMPNRIYVCMYISKASVLYLIDDIAPTITRLLPWILGHFFTSSSDLLNAFVLGALRVRSVVCVL